MRGRSLKELVVNPYLYSLLVGALMVVVGGWIVRSPYFGFPLVLFGDIIVCLSVICLLLMGALDRLEEKERYKWRVRRGV